MTSRKQPRSNERNDAVMTGETVDVSGRAPELFDLVESAWGIIANAGWDDCAKSPGWQEAAVRWRDRYHALLDAVCHAEPASSAPGMEATMGGDPNLRELWEPLSAAAGMGESGV